MLEIAIAAVVGYLLGSIPFGLLLTRVSGHGDIRKVGSGNIGATNVLRTGNRSLAAATLVGDALKGTVAVLVGGLASPVGALAAGLAALLGHVFPVWLQFRGGKGVATFLGVLIAVDWRLAAAFAVLWVTTAAVSRISSLSALTASLAVTVLAFVLSGTGVGVLVAVMVALLWWRHADNIRRLLAGRESRIGKGG